MDNIKIGKYLKNLRNNKNLTQQELAEILGVSPKTISKWECGDCIPEINMLYNISKFYDTTIDNILNGEEKVQIKVENNSKKNSRLFIYIGYVLFLLSIFSAFIIGSLHTLTAIIISVILLISSIVLLIVGYYLLNTEEKSLNNILFKKISIYFLISHILIFISSILSIIITQGVLSNNYYNNFNTSLDVSIILIVFALLIILTYFEKKNKLNNQKDSKRKYHNYITYFLLVSFLIILAFNYITLDNNKLNGYEIITYRNNIINIILLILYITSIIAALILDIFKSKINIKYLSLILGSILVFLYQTNYSYILSSSFSNHQMVGYLSISFYFYFYLFVDIFIFDMFNIFIEYDINKTIKMFNN